MLLCMCSILIPGLASLSQDWLLGKKSSSIDPEMPKKAIISVFKSYLVHFGSFKRRMFLVSLLHERKCLRNDLLKINCYLNVLFIIWFLYVLISITFVLWHIRRNDLGRNLFICRSATDIHAVVMGYSLCLILGLFFYNSLSTYMLYGYHSNESVF